MAKLTNPQQVQRRQAAQRWSAVLLSKGFTPVANLFLHHYHQLQPPISPSEVVLILHLMSFKWDAGHPRPAISTLATRMGVSTTAVRANARSLEVKGHLQRIGRTGTTNRFDLSPIIRRLELLVVEASSRKPEMIGTIASEHHTSVHEGTPSRA